MPNIEQEIAEIMDEICAESAKIIAAAATVYFQDRFEEKEWDGVPWAPAKNPPSRGSLMLRSRNLRDSIRPTEITKERVVITAGYEDRVTYAQVHNEGFEDNVNVNPFTRVVKGKQQEVRAHTRHMNIPRRQFMGETEELDERITASIESLIKSKFNNE